MSFPVPRHAQNPHHPLTRLRKQLSTSNHAVSREEFAQRTGIPLGSIKSLESGRYALTAQVAAKISLATGANPFDLLRGIAPIRDMTGQPLSPDSVVLEELATPFLNQKAGFENDQRIERIAFGVAQKKLKSMQLRFLLREAVVEALESLGLTELVAEELSEHLGEFDPSEVPYQLRPRKGPLAKRWEAFERLVRLEEDRLWKQKQDQDPGLREISDLSTEDKRRRQLEAAEFEQNLWVQALANVSKSSYEIASKDKVPSSSDA